MLLPFAVHYVNLIIVLAACTYLYIQILRYDWLMAPNYLKRQHCNETHPGHIPMVWGGGFHNDSFAKLPSDVNTLLGFNEPNIKAHSNLMPAEAGRVWKIIEALNPGKTLVGPAASQCGHNCNVGDAKHWYLEFFKHCPDCKVDYIATHIYVCHAQQLMNTLRDLWDTFHIPIWLTEFSCPHTHNPHAQLAFMKEILPQLEAADFVHRYSWFTHRYNNTNFVMSSTSLVEPHTNRLTALGHYYNNF